MITQETTRRNRAALVFDLALVLRGLEAAVDSIVQKELRRFQHRLRSFTPDQQQTIQLSLREIAYKILDPMVQILKQAVQQGDAQRIARICGLFNPLMQAREDESSE